MGRLGIALCTGMLLAVGCGGGEDGAGSAEPDVVVEPDVTPEPDMTEEPDVAEERDAAEEPDVPDEPLPAHAVPIGEQDDTFYTGPYVMHTTGESVSVAWETEAEGDTRVEYGPDDVYGEVVEGEPGTMHRVEIGGLEPSTVYHYRACSGDACTGDLTFSTAPAPGQAFRFVVYGDSRSDPPQHRAVADTIIESEPSVVFHTGDIVAQGAREEYRAMHFEPTRRLGHHVPVYVAIGNHEWKELNDEVAHFRDYLVYPKDTASPDFPPAGLNYSVRYGDAFFVVMDNTMDGGNVFVPIGDFDPPLYQWLKEQVASEAAQTAKWRFIFMHYPPSSPCHEDWGMMVATRTHVLPLVREHGFQAMFAGHVHNYERHDYDGFPVFITGGGGAGLEPEENCTRESDSLQLTRSVHHHMTIDLGPESALLQAVDVTGEVFDTVTLEP